MTYYWSTWLADALREDSVLAPKVMEYNPNWKRTGRPPAQFSYFPTGIVEHHTACMIRIGHDPASCANAILNGRADAPGPIAQLLGTWTAPGVKFTGKNYDPHILVLAAGRSNHAGSGEYIWGAPSGNGSAIGLEWCGPSESLEWPNQVVDFRCRVSAAIFKHNGWDPAKQLTTHHEYAPHRKIDPSGRYCLEPRLLWSDPWNAQTWRQAVSDFLTTGVLPSGTGTTPAPIPPQPQPQPPTPVGPMTLTAEDLKQIDKIVLGRLMEGTGGGQTTWAGTVKATLGTIQNAMNEIVVNGPASMQGKLDDVLALLADISRQLDST
jgi:N-acetylmuramoyl-L-alanine amidase